LSKPSVYQLANIVAVIASLIVNTLANALPFNGVTTKQVSDFYPNLFTPPGYVFSIWGVIYALSILFMVYQAMPNQRSEVYLAKIGFLYLVSSAANISWLLIFHYSYGVSTLFVLSLLPMVMLFLALLAIYQRLDIGRSRVTRNQKLAVHLPISVYVGWITLATIANTASVLNVLIPNIPLQTQELWTGVVIVVALAITALMVLTRRDFAFGLVVIWASVGIATNRAGVPVIFATSLLTAVVVALLILLMPILKKTSIVKFYALASR
jgi:hypothetical protein